MNAKKVHQNRSVRLCARKVVAMYAIGDKIVYPLYGAGVIEDIEEKYIDGQTQNYYVLKIPVGNLKVMISANKAQAQRVRSVLPQEKCLASLDVNAHVPACSDTSNWNQRYKENLERIKSGDLPQVALVFCSLLYRERERGLSTAEKKMMSTAKQIVLSEVILSMDLDRIKAEELVDSMFG